MIKLIPHCRVKRIVTVVVASCATFTTGCMSLENEEGRLPDAMRSAITGLTAKGYPDLTKIPDAPKDLPTAANWTALEARLADQGREVANSPNAAALTPEETNLDWAAKEKSALESDPRAEALPPVVAGAVGSPEWAAEARAKLEADLARLPPP
jgi:hypothetical protein